MSEPTPRLKSEIRVAAQLRRAEAAGAFAHVARKGDVDAGAIAVKVFLGRLEEGPAARLFIQSRDLEGALVWREPFDGPAAEEKIDEWLAKERRIDPDLWIVEIEDRAGRSFAE
jgi:hypothetical protein